jgi:hypothetical protein
VKFFVTKGVAFTHDVRDGKLGIYPYPVYDAPSDVPAVSRKPKTQQEA